MTAQIITHYTRRAVENAEQEAFLTQWHDADITARNREHFPWAGQLWERIAGRVHNATYGLTSIDDE